MMAGFGNAIRKYSVAGSKLALFLALLLVSVAAKAQTTGTISGVVTDKGGALAPSVQVTARNAASGEIRTTITNKDGEYSFPALAPGDYEITFALSGFATLVETATLNVTEHIAVNTTMQVATVATTVEVTTQEPLLQTESITQGGVISGEQVTQLPLASHSCNITASS